MESIKPSMVVLVLIPRGMMVSEDFSEECMRYEQVQQGSFISRPNRFIAQVLLDGKEETCHVKNTGRCRELLIPGAQVYVARAANPNRKTRFDLIAVKKGARLINIDSQAPNQAAAEALPELFPDAATIFPEYVHGDSRFDFFLKTPGKGTMVEVKGVTLEEDGIVLFPDAPTARGVKHLQGLIRCVNEGYEACLFLIVQTHPADCFMPNRKTDPDFADALTAARDAGVRILCMDCLVTPDSMTVYQNVPVRIQSASGVSTGGS